MTQRTAGILLIGNELLSGKISDENAYFLSQELFALGIEVRRVVVVPDEIDEVVEALNDLRDRVDMVFTSGGIGPTHDDITMEAVAKAVRRPLELHEGLRERAKQYFGDRLEPAHLKMITLPRGATLVESEKTRFPAIVVDGVYVMAGVPRILRGSFAAIREQLPSSAAHRVTTVYLKLDEWTLTPILDETIAAFPDIQVGSYPVLKDPTYRVRITLESVDADRVEGAVQYLVERLPEEKIVKVEREG